MRLIFLMLSLIMWAFGFWVYGQTFTGHLFLFFIAILGGLVGIAKAVLFADNDFA